MTFEEWFKKAQTENVGSQLTIARTAWDYQQNKLDIAIEALEFYAVDFWCEGSELALKAQCALERIRG